jgi:hypothetical protein
MIKVIKAKKIRFINKILAKLKELKRQLKELKTK